MGKLVVFELGDGDFERGFPVTLQIGEEGKNPSVEIRGKLPPNPDIFLNYQAWRSAYLGLETLYRASKKREQSNQDSLESESNEAAEVEIVYRLSKKEEQKTRGSFLEDCNQAAKELRDNLNNWLNSDAMRSLREKLLEKVLVSDEMRLLVKTDDVHMQRLPWHLWNLLEPYKKTEIAVIPKAFETIGKTSPKPKIRILAILGDSTGINTQVDADLLRKQLPGAEMEFLSEPQRQELTEKLWVQKGWDILFYAGHSSSEINDDNGWIKINKTDTLTISELKQSLKKAVDNGLKLAIFNSCDGLGLAKSLAELCIPQIIVMRQPVPDKVAQTFLKYFLEAFYRGESLYYAVKEARVKLEGLEKDFPCATWLPVIYQNSSEAPPTWKDWLEKSKDWIENQRRRLKLRNVFGAGLGVAILVVVVRSLGILQPLELKAFDQMLRWRPSEGLDDRLLIVRATESDFQQLNQDPLHDETLAKVLKKLEQYQPIAIGIDLYRDLPQTKGQEELLKLLKENKRIVAVCKLPDNGNIGIKPPPVDLPEERLGFTDVPEDTVRRRQYLSMDLKAQNICPTRYSFSFQLAAEYMEAKIAEYTKANAISTEAKKYHMAVNREKQEWQIGSVAFKRLRSHSGGYQKFDDGGYQILLNYRLPLEVAQSVTIMDVLKNRVNPEIVKNRIILIGADTNGRDRHVTPYNSGNEFPQDVAGVFIQAQMVSQIISAVENNRLLLSVWSLWSDALWIFGWSLVGGMLAWRCNTLLRLTIAGSVVFIILVGISFNFLLIKGVWFPFIPSAIALVGTGASLIIYIAIHAKQQNQLQRTGQV